MVPLSVPLRHTRSRNASVTQPGAFEMIEDAGITTLLADAEEAIDSDAGNGVDGESPPAARGARRRQQGIHASDAQVDVGAGCKQTGSMCHVLSEDLLGKIVAMVGCAGVPKVSLSCRAFAHACRSDLLWSLLTCQWAAPDTVGGKGADGQSAVKEAYKWRVHSQVRWGMACVRGGKLRQPPVCRLTRISAVVAPRPAAQAGVAAVSGSGTAISCMSLLKGGGSEAGARGRVWGKNGGILCVGMGNYVLPLYVNRLLWSSGGCDSSNGEKWAAGGRQESPVGDFDVDVDDVDVYSGSWELDMRAVVGGFPGGAEGAGRMRIEGREWCEEHRHEGNVTCMQSSQDKAFLVVGFSDGRVKAWGRTGCGAVHTAQAARQHKSVVRHVAVSVGGDGFYTAVSGSDDGTLGLRTYACSDRGARGQRAGSGDAVLLSAAKTLRGHGVSITSMDISPTHRERLWVASGGADGRCKVWEAGQGQCVFNARADRCGKVASLALVEPWAAVREDGASGVLGGVGGGWVPLVVAGMAAGVVNLYDIRVPAGYHGGRAALVASLCRSGGGGGVARVGSSRLHVRVARSDWRLAALWGQRIGSGVDTSASQLLPQVLRTSPTLVSVKCGGQHQLATQNSQGEVACFDLRRLGVCVNLQVGEHLASPQSIPVSTRAASSGFSEGGGVDKMPGHEPTGIKGGRYTSALEWEAGAKLSRAHTFCDVMSRDGAVEMACDGVKVVSCQAEDGRISALELASGQVSELEWLGRGPIARTGMGPKSQPLTPTCCLGR